MAIKQIFLGTVLILGMASVLLASAQEPMPDSTCYRLYETDYNPNNGWDTKIDVNTATGECTLTATRTITKLQTATGETYDLGKDWYITQQVKITANDTTGSKSKDEADLYAAGGSQSRHYEWQGNDWHMTSQTETRPSGSKETKETTKFDEEGFPVSRTWSDGKGYESTEIYYPKGYSLKSKEEKFPDGRRKITTHSRDGSVTVTEYGPDGKAIAKTRTDGKTGEVIVYNCHLKDAFSNQECVDMSRGPRGLGLYGGDRSQDTPRPQPHERAGDAFGSMTNASPFMSGLKSVGDPTDAKERVKADVLGQIEGKRRGDLIGVEDKTSTGVADQIKKRGDTVGLNLQPLPSGPAPDKSIQLKDTTKLEGSSVEQKEQAGTIRDRIRRSQHYYDERTGLQKGKLSVTPKSEAVGQKDKLSVTRRSQSVGQVFQDSGASKQKVQTQTIQPFKSKTKIEGFSAPAGSSGGFRAPR